MNHASIAQTHLLPRRSEEERRQIDTELMQPTAVRVLDGLVRQGFARREHRASRFRRPLRSSFPSLQATLAHMVEAEWVWSERWYRRSPTTQKTKQFTSECLSTLENIRDRWRPVEDSVRWFVVGLKTERLNQDLRYTSQEGKRSTCLLWEALFHLINHQSYHRGHRGQVTTLLRQLDAAPLQIDYLVARDKRFRSLSDAVPVETKKGAAVKEEIKGEY